LSAKKKGDKPLAPER
jgi:hypothetical protein